MKMVVNDLSCPEVKAVIIDAVTLNVRADANKSTCNFEDYSIGRTSFQAWVAELVDARDLKSLGA